MSGRVDIKTKILMMIRNPHLASFSTIAEDGKPWVRYVMPNTSEDLTIRFATFVGSRKAKHIAANPEVHLCCGVTDPMKAVHYLQIQGRAQVLSDKETKLAFWSDQMKVYFTGPEDPNYAVVVVKPYRIELWNMRSTSPEIWEAPQ